MKKILTTVVLALTFVVYSHAQQDVQYSNYMFNKLMHNAGYAGSKDAACLSISHRSQWLGLEGAPTTTGIQFHTPAFNDKVGFGLYIQNDRLGITDDWELGLSYAYHLLLGKRNGKLSIGIQGMMRQYSVNFSEGIVIDQSDESLPKTDGTKYVPNFGAGVYFSNDKLYAGVSIPHFLNSSIDFSGDNLVEKVISRESFFFNVMGGVHLPLSQKVELVPSALVKFTKNSPIAADINASLVFMDKFWIGPTVRLGGSTAQGGYIESVDAVLQWQINTSFRLGFSYDYSLTELQSYNDGSVEAWLSYCFKFNGKRLENPRYFF